MKLIDSSLRFPVTVVVGVLLAVLGGLLALRLVPIQLTPEVDRPIVTVTTVWPGASPEEIEKEIVEEQEEYLKSVEGVLKMTSESQDSRASIALEFPAGTDLVGATVRVNNKLNEVPSYPQTADRPVVSTSGVFDGAIAWFVIRKWDGAPEDLEILPAQFATFLEDTVKPRMERVDGVSRVNLFGGVEQELHVEFDPDLLASTGITVPELAAALRSENRDISAGDFGEGKRRYVVRTLSRFSSPEDVENSVIRMRDGVPIRVRDVARVELSFQKPGAQVRHKGQPAIAFNVQRRLGANVLDVTEGLLAQLDDINESLLHPRGLHVENVYRETIYIEAAIDKVFDNLWLGGILAIGVLFLFLRSVSSVAVIGVAIPISVITTFLSMYLLGRTINVISLAGMAFAVGMVVDNAIVVLENIYRHLQMGKRRIEAARDGAVEVWGAVLASTITTVAVFLPIVFIRERAGQLFQDIAIAISSAIVVSLIVSITVIPAASSRFLRASRLHPGEDEDPDPEELRSHGFVPWLAHRISAVVDRLNAGPLRRWVTIVALVAATLGLSWALLPPAEYLPNGNQNFVFGVLLPPPGYNLDEMVDIGKSVEDQLHPLWETPAEEAVDLAGGGVDNFFFVAMQSMSIVGARSRVDDRVQELLPPMNGAMMSVPGAFGFANQASLFQDGFAGTRSINVDVIGPELPRVLALAGRVFARIPEVLPGANGRPIPGLDLGNPEVRVVPDRVRAANVGFTATDIGQSVDALVDGTKVSEYFHQGREIDLLLKGGDGWTRHTQSISELPLATPGGRIVTVGDVASVSERQGPVQINHVERQRAVTIETVLPDDIPLEEAIERIEGEIVGPMRESGELGALYDVRLRGAADDLSRLRSALGTNFIVVLVLTYLLLAALFQSFGYPIVIMVTVPLATFGGVLGLRLVQVFDSAQQLDILTMLGFVILVGTVINNAILIVYQALQQLRSGEELRDAVQEAVRVRVRPILMSTMTSALGMLPLVVMPGAGSELYRGLGAVVVGGLVVSTVITLFLTPLVFSAAYGLMTRVRDLAGLDRDEAGEQDSDLLEGAEPAR